MSIVVNGTTITLVKHNGTDMTEMKVDGTSVWVKAVAAIAFDTGVRYSQLNGHINSYQDTTYTIPLPVPLTAPTVVNFTPNEPHIIDQTYGSRGTNLTINGIHVNTGTGTVTLPAGTSSIVLFFDTYNYASAPTDSPTPQSSCRVWGVAA